MTPPNPYVALGVVLGSLLALAGAFTAGYVVRGWKDGAAAGRAATTTEAAEDTRDFNIEAIGTAAGAAAAAAVNQNRSDTDASTQRIRTVVVPGDCARVPDGIVRELAEAAADTNAALGVGVRPGAAGAGAGPD